MQVSKKPTWISEILTSHGSFEQMSSKFSYLNKSRFVEKPMDCFRRDSPSLVRLDIAYGRGSAAKWLFGMLQGMFVFLGVTNDRFSKEQIYNLAQNIASNYKTLKVAEVMLFVSRFESGKYGRFYGDTSYALVVTESINQFMVEREHYYADIEREQAKAKIAKEKVGTITFDEYKKLKQSRGEDVSDELNSLFAKKD